MLSCLRFIDKIPTTGADIKFVHVCDGERECGPVSPVRAQDVPRSSASGKVCKKLSGCQEGHPSS